MTKKQKAKIDGRVGEAYGYIRIPPPFINERGEVVEWIPWDEV